MLAVMAACAACGSVARDPAADAAKGAAAAGADTPSWLLVLRAGTGTYTATGETGTLVMHDVDPTYLAFTDRPARKTRRGAIETLVANWDAAFAGSAPNAAISLDESGADGDTLVVTLGTPTLGTDGSLTFRATPVPETDDAWSELVGRAPDRAMPAAFGPVSLYVDDLQIEEIGIDIVVRDGPAGIGPPQDATS